MIRLFRLNYNGYYPDTYRYRPTPTSRTWVYPSQELFLSRTAAEAVMFKHLALSPSDQREMKHDEYYNPWWGITELNNYQVVEHLTHNGYIYLLGYPEDAHPNFHTNIWGREAFWNNVYQEEHGYYRELTFRTEDGNVNYFDIDAMRFIQMKPGKFLKKFFADRLTDRQIAYQAEYFKSGTRPPLKIDLEFAYTEEEMLRVYAEGPQSCMKGSDSVVAYAGGDLALCYAILDGKIMGRVLCWPENKVFGRVYPNDGNWSRDGFESAQQADDLKATMISRLREMGYVSLEENPTGFDGARLQFKPVAVKLDVKMPYLDLGVRVDILEDGTPIMKRSGALGSGSTAGIMSYSEHTCGVCETRKAVDQDGHAQVRKDWRGSATTHVCGQCRTDLGKRLWRDEWNTGYTFLLGEDQEPVEIYTTPFTTVEEAAKLGKDYRRWTHPDDTNLWQDDITKLWYSSRYVTEYTTKSGVSTVEGNVRYDYNDTGQYYLHEEKFPSEIRAEQRAAKAKKKEVVDDTSPLSRLVA